jgi:hypothetical protein
MSPSQLRGEDARLHRAGGWAAPGLFNGERTQHCDRDRCRDAFSAMELESEVRMHNSRKLADSQVSVNETNSKNGSGSVFCAWKNAVLRRRPHLLDRGTCFGVGRR